MGTFKIKKTVKTEKEVEINSFPHFRKSGTYCFYKLIDEERCIRVGTWTNRESIEFQNSCLAFDEGSQEISEEEFQVKFDEAINKLSV